jgi:hypothetical protein
MLATSVFVLLLYTYRTRPFMEKVGCGIEAKDSQTQNNAGQHIMVATAYRTCTMHREDNRGILHKFTILFRRRLWEEAKYLEDQIRMGTVAHHRQAE